MYYTLRHYIERNYQILVTALFHNPEGTARTSYLVMRGRHYTVDESDFCTRDTCASFDIRLSNQLIIHRFLAVNDASILDACIL